MSQDPATTGRPSSPIKRRNLGSDVYSILWDRILSRDLFPGEKLSDLRLSEEAGFAHLRVSDDGPGLPDGMEAQVFDRFVRGQGPADRTSRNGTGTGLGLSIVRAVAVAHGGSVTASRSESGGAAFDVTLPLQPAGEV